MFKRLIVALGLLAALALPAHGRERVSGWCEQGGNTATVGGLTSTEDVQESFASCTVTVYDVGTLDIASIFSDDSGTAKANPFTASTTGFWFWYADDARYDVRLSGGGIVTPFTIGDILLDDTKNDVTTISTVSFSATPTIDASLGSIFTLTLTANVTSSTISNPVTGQRITLRISQDATGGWTFVYPVNTVFHGVAPTIALAPSAITSSIFYFDGTNWQETSHAANEMHWPEMNEVVQAHMQAGADEGAQLTNCLARLPATGGTWDGGGLQGAGAISTTVAITRPTEILLDATTLTSSVAPAFSFDTGSDGSSLVCTEATRITFANSIADSSRLIRIQNTSDITIKGCELGGNGNNAAAGEQNHNIIVIASTDVLITQNVIHDAQGDGVLLADADRVFVTENTFYNLGRQGVTLFGPTINNISVTNNKFRVGTRVSTSTAAGNFVHAEGTITAGAGKNIIISDNQMDGQGISITSAGGPWSGVEVNGNVIRADESDSLDAGIELREMQDFVVDGNVIIGATGVARIGIRLFDISAVADTGRGKISNNIIRSMGSIGINLTGTVAPSLGHVSITGNIISNCQDVGIQVDTDWPKTTITGNTVTDCTSWGIDFQDSQDFVIAGNVLLDNGSGAGGRGIVVRVSGGSAAGRGLIYGNEVRYASSASTQGIQIDSNASIDRVLIFGNDVADTATPLNLGASATNIHAYMNRTVTSGTPIWTSEFELDGDFNHDGTNAGFYGVAPVARPGATDEIKAALALIGLLMDAGASPLDLDGGLLTAGGVVATAGVIEYTDAPTLAASTTPSVTGGNAFLTNSTASITDFTGEQNGQVIILLCEADTTTSLTDSTPLFLAGAFTCTTNDTITLISNGTVWYEVARGVN